MNAIDRTVDSFRQFVAQAPEIPQPVIVQIAAVTLAAWAALTLAVRT